MGACTSDRHISTSITNKIHNQNENHRVDIMKLEIIIHINNQNRTS